MTYTHYNFPQPQYLGAKYIHLDWLKQYIPTNTKTVLDAFAGSQSVSFLFKQLAFKTITNDFLKFNNQIGLSIIENKTDILTEKDVKILFSDNIDKINFKLIETQYSNLFFEKEEAIFLDNFRANISLLDNKYKQALAFTVINRSMTRKITMGHFAHTQALVYARDAERIKRNRS